ADPDRKTLASLDREREVRLPHRGLDDVLNRPDRDAVAGGGLALHADVEIGRPRHLLGVDVGRSRDGPQNVGDDARSLLQSIEVVAEDLDAYLRADAGGQHVDAIDDRLRPDVRHTGQRGGLIQLADELL